MTTNGAAVDLLGALVRADKSWARTHGDEPRERQYMEWLEQHARERVAVEAPDQRMAEAERELTARTAALDQLVAEVDSARADHRRVADELSATEQELESTRDERARLAEQLAEAQGTAGHVDQASVNALAELEKVKSANAVLRQKLRRAIERADEAGGKHVHRYPAPGPGLPLEPCECGRPYPRYFEDVDEDEDGAPDVEPWADLFDRIRDEIAEWPGATES